MSIALPSFDLPLDLSSAGSLSTVDDASTSIDSLKLALNSSTLPDSVKEAAKNSSSDAQTQKKKRKTKEYVPTAVRQSEIAQNWLTNDQNNVIGGLGKTVRDPETGESVFQPGEHAMDCLRDILRNLRRDNPQKRHL